MMHALSWLLFWAYAATSHGFGGGANKWARAKLLRSFGGRPNIAAPLFAGTSGGGETVAELKEQLHARGLKVTGLKAELKARLLESKEAAQPVVLDLDLFDDTAPPTDLGNKIAVSVKGSLSKEEGARRPSAVVHLSKKQKQLYMGKDEPLSKVVFVGNLDLNVEDLEAQTRSVFEAHGALVSVTMGRNKKTGQPAAYAMVEFEKDEGAASAVGALHLDALSALTLPSCALRVELSHQTGSASRTRERNKCALSDERIGELVHEREQQRAEGFFRASDRLRELLEREGVRVDDTARTWSTGDGRSGDMGETVVPRGKGNRVGNLFEEELNSSLGHKQRGETEVANGKGGGTRRADDRAGDRSDNRGRGRGGGRRDSPRDSNRNFGPSGHDYARCAADVAGPRVGAAVTEIDALLAKRLVAKLKSDFEAADNIKGKLQTMGVEVNDNIKEWRADGRADREWLMRGREVRPQSYGGAGGRSSTNRRDY